jgi:hypothetical protein
VKLSVLLLGSGISDGARHSDMSWQTEKGAEAMLCSVNELMNYQMMASDGEIGRSKDFLFDERNWVVRYMVADAHKWLPRLTVLVSPIALDLLDCENRRLPVKMTRNEIEDGPPLEQDATVSREYEIRLFKHYGWLPYWAGNDVWGTVRYPNLLYGKKQEEFAEEAQEPKSEQLRSVNEVKGLHIQASNGKVGHVEDFILDEPVWILRYMVVDTLNFLPGREKEVLLKLEHVNSVDWADRKMRVNLNTEAIRNSPEYDLSVPLNREFELVLHDYYGWPKYWE